MEAANVQHELAMTGRTRRLGNTSRGKHDAVSMTTSGGSSVTFARRTSVNERFNEWSLARAPLSAIFSPVRLQLFSPNTRPPEVRL